MTFVGMLIERQQHVGFITGTEDLARTDADFGIDGPPEMVDGIVMKVMTSCSLRPARRARKPPMA